MEMGYLVVETFLGERLSPVVGSRIVVECNKGREMHEIFTDENGRSAQVSLPATTRGENAAPGGIPQPRCERYIITISQKRGFRKIIVHGVEIFPGIVSILPVQMLPDPHGEYGPYEIFIPDYRGADLYERAQSRKFRVSGLLTTSSPKLAVPSHITVHMGRPDEPAERLVITLKDYIKNIASCENNPTLESAALGSNILIQMSIALEKITSRNYRARGYDFDITSSGDHDLGFIKGRNIFNNVSGIVDELWGFYILANDEFAHAPILDDAWQHSARALAIRGYNPAQIIHYLCPGLELVAFEEADLREVDVLCEDEREGVDAEAERVVEGQSQSQRNGQSHINPAVLMALSMFGRRW